MKRFYTLFLALTFIITASYAQKGLSLGANGAVTGIAILNQNTWGVGAEYDFLTTFSGSYGVDVGYNFTDNLGLYTGFWFMTFGQDYKDSYDGSIWERGLRFKYNVIPIMFKYTGSQAKVNFVGGIGILYAMMNQSDQTWTMDGSDFHEIGETINSKEEFDLGASDVTDRYTKNDIILNLELGARIIVIENLYIDASLNFGYGLTDINDPDYHFVNKDGNYDPSHNAYVGFKVGMAYVLFGE